MYITPEEPEQIHTVLVCEVKLDPKAAFSNRMGCVKSVDRLRAREFPIISKTLYMVKSHKSTDTSDVYTPAWRMRTKLKDGLAATKI